MQRFRHGRVIFAGKAPGMVVEKTFLNASMTSPEIGWAMTEKSSALSSATLAALPSPDVEMSAPAPAVKYQHRRMKDGDVYYFFNEGTGRVESRVKLAGAGAVQVWDAAEGKIRTISATKLGNGRVEAPLMLEAHESQCIVIGPESEN
jgi:hypothetical protein